MKPTLQDSETDIISTEVKILVEAVSVQTKVSNRAWFALVAFALIIVVPTEKRDFVTLPFGLQKVSADQFYTFALPFLTILMVYFCQSYAQESRASRLAQKLIDNSKHSGSLHPR